LLRVLHHYLPIRKAVLILSETVLLTLVIAAWMTAHLWDPSTEVIQGLAREIPGMNQPDALARCFASALLLSVLAQLAIAFNELYDVRISSSRYDRAARFVESAGSALGLTIVAVVLVHTWRLKRVLDFPPLSLSTRVQTLVFAMLSGFVLLYFWRTFFHYMLRRASFSERVLILGTGKAAHALAREMLERSDTGYEIVGLVPEPGESTASARRSSERVVGGTLVAAGEARRAGGRTGDRIQEPLARDGVQATPVARLAGTADTQALVLDPLPPASGESRLGHGYAPSDLRGGHDGNREAGSSDGASPTTLFDLCQDHRIDVLVVALEDRRNNLPTEQLLHCRLAGIPVREQEAIYEQITGKIAIEALRPSYLIFNEGFSRDPWNELSKRLVDVVLASVILVLTWPLMLATAIAVRMDSPGPILFSQERVGRDGRRFTLLKFRSMRADAEKMTGPVWATADDPRITRSGRFIRKTRLDELPQLFNVIAGHMSLVGPRPEREHFVDDLAKKIPYFRQRHIVKPGLTGWAQINYRYGNTHEDAVQKLQYDLFYIKNQSLLFDLSILFNTVKIVILRKGT
jgi:lipopolysaccharide/colanic/teichoic acid biosynthesis glycosyltransferase